MNETAAVVDPDPTLDVMQHFATTWLRKVLTVGVTEETWAQMDELLQAAWDPGSTDRAGLFARITAELRSRLEFLLERESWYQWGAWAWPERARVIISPHGPGADLHRFTVIDVVDLEEGLRIAEFPDPEKAVASLNL